jgi:hypothetical protein
MNVKGSTWQRRNRAHMRVRMGRGGRLPCRAPNPSKRRLALARGGGQPAWPAALLGNELTMVRITLMLVNHTHAVNHTPIHRPCR